MIDTTSDNHSKALAPQSLSAMPPLMPMLQRIAMASEANAPLELRQALDQALAKPDAPDADGEYGEQALRSALFPVTRQHSYMNHAAVGPFPAPVEAALRQALRDTSLHGSVAAEASSAESLARERFARLINAPSRCIAFTKNVSDSFMTVASGLDWREGDNVVTADIEFPSNVYPWLNLQEQGVETRFAPSRDGRIPIDEIAKRIDDRTRVISLSFVEFGTGARNDLAALAALAHAHGALFGVDCIQGLGALQLDVTACEIDFLAAGTAKWLLTPAHLGLLYVRPSLLADMRVARRGWLSVETPFDFFTYTQSLRDDAGRLEGGSNNFVGLVGLAAALDVLEAAGMADVEARTLALADLLRDGLRERGHHVLSPDALNERSGIVCFQPRRAKDASDSQVDTTALVAMLAERAGVIISARNGLARVSPHFYNTPADVTRLLDALDDALN